MDEATNELIRRFRAGDEAAFEELAERLAPRIHRLASRTLGGDRSLAEDVVQEALLRVYGRLRHLAATDAFDGWIYRITLNLINDQFRRLGRERAAVQEREELDRLERPPERPSGLEQAELRRTLTEALAALDELHREVFVLKELEGLPHAKIARLLEIPEGTVWSRLAYARKRLRERLARRGLGGKS